MSEDDVFRADTSLSEALFEQVPLKLVIVHGPTRMIMCASF